MSVRLGLIKPSAGNLPFWKRIAPEGVEILAEYLGYQVGNRATFEAGFEKAERLAEGLKAQGCELVLMTGTPPSLLLSLEFERSWRKQVARRLGLPVVSAMEPHALALQAMGVRKVAVATYYGDELNQAIVRYLAIFGMEAVLMGGFRLTDSGEALFTTPMGSQHDIPAEQVYSYCREGLERSGAGVDAVYINGGGWKNVEHIIPSMEQDFGTKVVWGPVAEMWFVYWKLGIPFKHPAGGGLTRDAYEPSLSRQEWV